MFCPKCATQNADGASFCRSCGANVSLVPQALSGQLAQPQEEVDPSCSLTKRRKGEPSLEPAIRNVFMGVAFLMVAMALAFSRMGTGWWFWMMIPAFSMMGTGVAQYMRFKEKEKQALRPRSFAQSSIQAPPLTNSFPVRNTGELIAPPPSVTEGTTRHLGAEAPTRHLDATTESHKIN